MAVVSVIAVVLGIYMLSLGIAGPWGLVFIALGSLYFLPIGRRYPRERGK